MKTLHEAIIQVLKDSDKPMSYNDIADKINSTKLFIRPSDGQPVQAFQIRLRTFVSNSYKHLFEVKENMVKLKEQ